MLSPHHLPEAELHAALLDGDLVRVGGAFCTIDTIIGAEHRAASVAAEVTSRAIAELHTAAWIYGLLPDVPRRLFLCVDATSGFRPQSTARQVFQEVVIEDGDVISVGGLAVTTPLRTALDLARMCGASSATEELIRELSVLDRGFTFADCCAWIERRKNLPYKHQALAVLASAFDERWPV